MTREETDLLQTLEQRVKSHGESCLTEQDKAWLYKLRGTAPNPVAEQETASNEEIEQE